MNTLEKHLENEEQKEFFKQKEEEQKLLSIKNNIVLFGNFLDILRKIG